MYSQVTDLFGNVHVKLKNTKIFDLLTRCHYILNPPRTYDFSTLHTTLPHDLIKNQLVDLMENTFRREKVLYLACNEERAFFASEEHKNIVYGLVKK